MEKKIQKFLIFSFLLIISSSILIPIVQNSQFQSVYDDNHQHEFYFDKVSNSEGNTSHSYTFNSYNSSLSIIKNSYFLDFDEELHSVIYPNKTYIKEMDSKATIHNFRYLYSLISLYSHEMGDFEDVEFANKILSGIYSTQKRVGIYASSIFNGYDGWGGYHEFYPVEYSRDFGYDVRDTKTLIQIFPYIVKLLDFYNTHQESNPQIISQENLTIFNQIFRFNLDLLIRLEFDIENLDFQLMRIAGILMANSLIKSRNLEYQALSFLDSIIRRAESAIDPFDYNGTNMEMFLASLYLIENYLPNDYSPAFHKFITTIIEKGVLQEPNIDGTNYYKPFFNNQTTFDTVLLTRANSTQLWEYYVEYISTDAIDMESQEVMSHITLRTFLTYQSQLLFGGIVVLLFIVFRFLYGDKKKKEESHKEIEVEENEQNREEKEEGSFSDNFAPFSLAISSITIIFFVSAWNFDFVMYVFLFLWPFMFLYGFNIKREMNYYSLLFFLEFLLGLSILAFVTPSSVSIIDIYVFIWIIEIIHSVYITQQLIRGKSIGKGFNSRNMGYVLLLPTFAEILYLFVFLNNIYLPAIPILLTYGLWFKSINLLRSRCG